MNSTITIRNARLHNLKNVSLEIPKNKLVVFTGISGSGKSTLAFDILNKEGQRQYLESLGFVGDGLSKPPVDAILGLSPTISIDQHLTNHSPRSTVGTSTEVFTYLRVLFARLGHRPCPSCGKDGPPYTDPANLGWETDRGSDRETEAGAADGKGVPGAPLDDEGLVGPRQAPPGGVLRADEVAAVPGRERSPRDRDHGDDPAASEHLVDRI